MTTIAFDGSLLCADRAHFEDGVIIGEGPKIAKRADGAIAGAAGPAYLCAEFLRWFEAGAQGAPPPMGDGEKEAATAIVVTTDGSVTRYERGGYFPVTGRIALGAGALIALGVMDTGANAVTAVHIATQRIGGDPNALDALMLVKPSEAAQLHVVEQQPAA